MDNLVIDNFFTKIFNELVTLLNNVLEKHNSIKFNLVLFCKYIKKMGTFQERGSGWTLLEILYIEVNINNRRILKAITSINS